MLMIFFFGGGGSMPNLYLLGRTGSGFRKLTFELGTVMMLLQRFQLLVTASALYGYCHH